MQRDQKSLREVSVIGIGLTKFGRYPDKPVEELGAEAIERALDDASVPFKDVEVAYCGHVLQPMGTGLKAVSAIGMTGIPIINVEMACASGTTALREAFLGIGVGLYDVALVVGLEKMGKGLLQVSNSETYEHRMGLAVTPVWSAMRARRYMHETGAPPDVFARAAVKNRQNGSLNPNAHFQTAYTLEDVLNSRLIADPLTLLQCSANSDGAAAAIVCASEVAHRYGGQPIQIAGYAAGSPRFEPPRRGAQGEVEGFAMDEDDMSGMIERLAKEAYEVTGIGPEDVEVAQLHDAFSYGEVRYIEDLGFFAPGEGWRAILDGRTELTGDKPVNTDGGLMSRGHPIGASGVAMVAEIVAQLRGQAGPRQVAGKDGQGPKVGLVHNNGVGGTNIMLFNR